MRYAAMDGLRGLFALWVVLVHAPFLSSIFHTPFVLHPAPMLTVFFVFSGFVVALMYGESIQDGRDAARFLIKRLGRLWPLHAAMLAFLLAFETLRWLAVRHLGVDAAHEPFTDGTNLPAFVENVFFIQAWGWDKPMTWNFPAWTISTEIGAYLVLCAICMLVKTVGSRIALGLVASAIAGFVYYLQADGWTRIGELASVPRAVMEFFFGFTVYFIARRFPFKGFWIGSILEVGSFAGAVAISFARLDGLWLLATGFCFALMGYALACEQGVVSRYARAKVLVWLGDISYSIYLTHVPVIYVIGAVVAVAARYFETDLWTTVDTMVGPREVMDFGGVEVMNAMLALLVVIVVGVSALTNRWIEKPARVWFARFADARFGKRMTPQDRPAAPTPGVAD